MKGFILTSPAKVNLCLDVLSKDSDLPYHHIKTVFQEIDVCDRIEFIYGKSDITVECQGEFPIDISKNSLLDAAYVLKKELGVRAGAILRIRKQIPAQSGLGGASSNAATVLIGLNTLWGLDLSLSQLSRWAVKLGMDTNFFLHGGTSLGEHFGEKIIPLPRIKNCFFVIVFASMFVSTPWAYSHISGTGRNVGLTENLVGELTDSNGSLSSFSLLHNDFDDLVIKHFPVALDIFSALSDSGACSWHVCGSGGGVYGIFDDRGKRDRAVMILKRPGWYVWKADVPI